jgi:hypothetical protein
MRTMHAILGLTALFSAPVWASNPGEPLSIEDWTIGLPGLTAESLTLNEDPYACVGLEPDLGCIRLNMFQDNAVGADGSIYYIVGGDEHIWGLILCETGAGFCFPREIRRYTPGGNTEIVARIEERAGLGGTIDRLEHHGLHVDNANGLLYERFLASCKEDNDGVPECAYQGQLEVMRIAGLPTTFEILQTYTPPSGPISFRVPYMPEGFQAADWFDTYYGDLATVGDWGQAQPLQCGYPASPPSVGDYLTVADPLPPPSPGQGRYYVTAVNFMGERRYGRKRAGGVTSGRDPGVLPACAMSSSNM